MKKKTIEKEKTVKTKTAKQTNIKLSNIIKYGIFAIIVVTCVLYYALGWQKTIYDINIYLNAVIVSLFILVVSNLLLKLIRLIMNKITVKSQKAKTVNTLLQSLIKYVIVIVSIIAIMIQFLGSKYMTELFAGLGVVALVVGLGCQTLINDIVAGIFMVLEGNYQVGDVVVINGWRGTVNSIGLRTTVIEDIGGNLKIINNSSISEVVNNSQALSIASCVYGIEYDEKIERVENVIADNLEIIKANIPTIVDGPYYKGIEELAGSSVNIKIVAKCKEDDKYQVQRDLNRELKRIFDSNNINFPYPQITLSNRKQTVDHKLTAKAKKSAEEFVNEQKETSFDYENNN